MLELHIIIYYYLIEEVQMGIIVSSVKINAPVDEVFALARKVEDFPDFMPDVKTVEVRERRDDGYTKTYWEAIAKIQRIVKVIRWEEEENWDVEKLSCTFAQTRGDYKHYKGGWKFEDAGDATRVELTVDYDLGLPLIGPLIRRLLDKIMKENCDSMLKALKEKAEMKKGSN